MVSSKKEENDKIFGSTRMIGSMAIRTIQNQPDISRYAWHLAAFRGKAFLVNISNSYIPLVKSILTRF